MTKKRSPKKSPKNKKSPKKQLLKDMTQHERYLKSYVDPIVRECVGRHYSTGPVGYLLMVGGEALNHHLPPEMQVVTSDYDLKLVVTPKFTNTEENLRKANVKRLYLLKDLKNCLSSMQPPPGYKSLFPRMTILFKDTVRELEIEGSRVFMIDPETGAKIPFVYRFNKVFTIKLVYALENQPEDEPHEEFTLIDLGLYYRLPPTEPYYNFLTKKIYDTFLYPPFSRPIPVPFVVDSNKIRYPILPYILVDNFRMILFANDFLTLYKDNPAKIDFFKSKLAGYNKKLKMILEYFKDGYNKPILSNRSIQEIVKDVEREIRRTVSLYEPLVPLNALCYREEGKYYFTPELQSDKKGCDQKYLDKLDTFYEAYNRTLHVINELMPPRGYIEQNRSRSPRRSKSRSRRSPRRSKSRSRRSPRKSKSRSRRYSKSRSR